MSHELEVLFIVVDDEDGMRDLLRGVTEGIIKREVPSFVNGLDAWEFVQENDVRVIISDINMPFMDGLELLKHVKQSYPHIIFVIVSAKPENATEAERLGADFFFAKPFNYLHFKDLISRIASEISKRIIPTK